MLPLDRLHVFIRQNGLFLPSERVLLAVSGGRDSVLMAHFFHQAGFSFGIAHCNFMLRDDEADADELFTQKLARSLNVPFHSIRFHTSGYAAEKGISIQMAARELRYNWLEDLRSHENYAFIATAHHQNDAMETTILNLVRGTGIAGLHGIAAKRGNIIRPLLFLTREEVDDLVRAENISYRDDHSNFSAKYARNKIRLEVIPKLKELNPNLEGTFETNSKRFAELEILLKEKVAEVSAEVLTEKNGRFYIETIKLENLRPLHTLLFEVLKPFSFSEAVVSDLIWSLNGQPGLKFESPTHQLVIDRQQLIISPKDEPVTAPVIVSANEKQVVWQGHKICISGPDPNNQDLQKAPYVAQVDAERLQFPLVLRSWHQGDSFRPLGLQGKKKVSDFFIGQKLPVTEKAKIPILFNGNGDIIWIVGMRLDDRYKVTANTKKVYIFELK